MTFAQSMERPGPLKGQPKKEEMGSNGGNAHHSRDPRGKRRQDAEQMVRFVRDYQGLQRETTELRLKRVAPLPGIGETPQPFKKDATGIGKISENGPLICTSPRSKNAPWNQIDTDICDRVNHSCNSSTDLGIYGKARLGVDGLQPCKMPRRRHSDRNVNRRITADVRLPPLSVSHRDLGEIRNHNDDQRPELPERPQAPSPSVTPPLPDEFRDDCSQASESPVDFLDIH